MKNRTRVAALSLLTLLFPILAAAAGQEVEPVAQSSRSTGSIQFSPAMEYDHVSLIVSNAAGVVISKDFASGKNPGFTLADLSKNAPADGSYTYELRVAGKISDETRKQLAAARAADDDGAIERISKAAGLGQTLVQSGVFTVRNGMIVTDASEAPAPGGRAKASNAVKDNKGITNDVVTPDDAIIQGSLCVGLDCVNNESFGFDTIRLKENNTRIKFEDTSSSAGFPTTDWQLTANDSASGGANKFSIEDITSSKVPFTITGAAPTNSLFVDSSGRVGLGTASPALKLHESQGDTPAIRLEQTNVSGFTAQTWDIGANEANFFVRDVTGGSRLSLRIRPGAPTSSVDIAASGNVGIGTASPGSNMKMDVRMTTQGDVLSVGGQQSPGVQWTTTQTDSNARNWGIFTNFNSFGDFNILHSTTNTGNSFLATTALTITKDGFVGLGVTAPTRPLEATNGAFLSAGGTWTNASSRDLKQDIRDLDSNEAMDALKALDPVKYAYKVDPSEKHVGFIAEDVPSLVATKDRKSLSPMDVVAVLTKVVQDQQKTIDALKARVDQLESH
jgi:hypothetical protein